MNYIKQLQADNAALKLIVLDALEEIETFNRLLNSPKHNGVDINGDRSDWISTSDVLNRMQLFKVALDGGYLLGLDENAITAQLNAVRIPCNNQTPFNKGDR